MHLSAELLSRPFTAAALRALPGSAPHASGNCKRETFPAIPCQPWPCSHPSPEFSGPQTQLLHPYPILRLHYLLHPQRTMPYRAAVTRKTAAAAQIVKVNTCIAGSAAQLCHLGLPMHFFDALICQCRGQAQELLRRLGNNQLARRLQVTAWKQRKAEKGKGQLLG